MSKGQIVLNRIDGEIAALRKDEAASAAHISEISGQIAEMRRREIDDFRQLAVFRLGETSGATLNGTLNQADRELQRLRSVRDASLADVDSDLAATKSAIEHLEAERLSRSSKTASLQAEIDAADEKLLADLAGNDDYKALLAAAETAEAVAVEAERKAELANNDRAGKGEPYEADPLFMYLWNRRFGTSDYHRRGLIRLLDGWVARLVRYHDARPNYHMLLEIPKRLGEHADRTREAAVSESEKLEDFEARQRDNAGILDRARKLDADEAELGGINQKLVEQTGARTAFEARRAAINRGEDEASRSALEALVSALQDTRLKDLHRAALLTPDPADERLVDQIDELREHIEDLEHDLDRRSRVERDIEKKLAELDDVRGRFVGERLDDNRWEFDDDMVEDALKSLLRGAVNAAVVWAELKRRGRYTPGPMRPRRRSRRRSGGSIFGRRSGSKGGFGRGGFGGGGFGSGGGFGGGGFKTGGSF